MDRKILRFVAPALIVASNWSVGYAQPTSQIIPQASIYFDNGITTYTAPAFTGASLPIWVNTIIPFTNSDGIAGSFAQVGWSLDGAKLTIKFVTQPPFLDDILPPGPVARDTVKLPPLAPGEYQIELGTEVREGQYRATDSRRLVVSAVPATIVARTFANRPTRKFFLSASETDADLLLALRAPGSTPALPIVEWAVAEESLRAWPATGAAPSAARPVCRFYQPVVNTHFYSSNQAECDLLKRTAPWIDEGIAFRALVPDNGNCPIGTDAVYRLFNASLSNHRYTRSEATRLGFGAAGWVNEGVAFCSPRS